VLTSEGLMCLLPAIESMHSSPRKLNLSHTGITSRGVNRLMDVVQSKCETADELETLDLSDNCLKGEDVAVSVSGSFLFALLCDVDVVTLHRSFSVCTVMLCSAMMCCYTSNHIYNPCSEGALSCYAVL